MPVLKKIGSSYYLTPNCRSSLSDLPWTTAAYWVHRFCCGEPMQWRGRTWRCFVCGKTRLILSQRETGFVGKAQEASGGEGVRIPISRLL